jgi:hypothetical protein
MSRQQNAGNVEDVMYKQPVFDVLTELGDRFKELPSECFLP